MTNVLYALLAWAISVGLVILYMAQPPSLVRSPIAHFPVRIDPNLVENHQTVQLPPMVFMVRVVSRPEFAKWKQDADKTRAFAVLSANPCEVVLPAGWYLEANTKNGHVRWLNPDNAVTLAHEILHCAAGRWHR